MQTTVLKSQVASLQDTLEAAVKERDDLKSELAAARRQLEAQQSYEVLLTNMGQALRPAGSPRTFAATP